jgi:hypothetical protein
MSVIKSGNNSHDAACVSAELARQNAMATATTTAQIAAVDIAFYRAVIASCKLNGLPYSNFQHALWCLGTGGQ